jgi:hypothetical protein
MGKFKRLGCHVEPYFGRVDLVFHTHSSLRHLLTILPIGLWTDLAAIHCLNVRFDDYSWNYDHYVGHRDRFQVSRASNTSQAGYAVSFDGLHVRESHVGRPC